MRILISFFAVLSMSAVMMAQSGGKIQGGAVDTRPHTPERGSPERKAILDALRVPVEKQLKQSVVFKVNELNVQKGWAFMLGVPQQPDGNPVDYTGTVYQTAKDDGVFDDGIVALLRNRNGKWQVVQLVIGATDVPYVDWDKKYRAPRAIFNIP